MSSVKDWLWKLNYRCKGKLYKVCDDYSDMLLRAMKNNSVIVKQTCGDNITVVTVSIGKHVIWVENRFYSFGYVYYVSGNDFGKNRIVKKVMPNSDVALQLWKEVKRLEDKLRLDRDLELKRSFDD